MPTYNFTCRDGHTVEKRAGISCDLIPCPICGLPAQREAVYQDQAVFTETGAKFTRRAEVPRDERRHDKDFKRFQEASQELDYTHKKNEETVGHELPSKSLWKQAKKRARAIQQGLVPPVKATA